MNTVHRKGFTLIELLAVMMIMAMMSAVAVSSYFAATRGAAMRAAIAHLRGALHLARQTAIMHGRSAYLLVDETGYSLCKVEGLGTGQGKSLRDEYADWSNLSTNMRIFNLSSSDGRNALVKFIGQDTNTAIWNLQTDSAIWTAQSKYGWELYPKSVFPRGFKFMSGFPRRVIFRADGTIEDAQGYEFEIVEEINPDHMAKVKVDYPTGRVAVEMK